ncbi:MAG: NAD(P)H-hydrate dehydratase [Chitinivibrionales bacterium]|nr:NAD(P)H-hydrate dehydratase [Chitinivibrionales bacterium]
MIPVVTVSQMRAVDRDAIGDNIQTGFGYMRKAGDGLFEAIGALAPDPSAGDIGIVCGKGNNGGDGYVVGKLLLDAGYGVMCYAVCEGDDYHGEAKQAYEEYIDANGNFLVLKDLDDFGDPHQFQLIVDAVLGTGMQGNPRGIAAEVIRRINISSVPVVAVDTPSGLNNDTGTCGYPCIRAVATVTMGYPKIGTYFQPGRHEVGRLIIKDLGYPPEILRKHFSYVYVPTLHEFRALMPPRKLAGSKIDHGLACLVCGSRGMTGSASLAAQSALRTGCGMVHLASSSSALMPLSVKLEEPVLYGLEETVQGTIAESALENIRSIALGKDALLVGSGLSHITSTTRMVRKLVASADAPVVLDADGINAYKGAEQELKKHSSELLITPHRGEWRRLFGPLPQSPLETIEQIKKAAAEYELTILLKGNPTLVVDQRGSAFILPFGNSSLATAGTGDVLSGIVVSLIAQGSSPVDAAVLGVYLHGRAGELAGQELTQYSVVASDIIRYLPRVLASLL